MRYLAFSRFPLRSGVLIALAIPACTSHPLSAPLPEPEQTSIVKININPSRKLDMIFMVDNSASMGPKQDKLAAQFPRLIDALKDPSANPPLPDMRIAIIDSDLGSGASGRCLPQYGDKGLFQMRDTSCGANPGARWLEYDSTGKGNFAGDISTVFGCYAHAVGQVGCGFENQLQAVNWALNLQDSTTKKTQAQDFVRPDAYLAIVLLTDEDDCSLPTNSLLADKDLSSTESWSLRCSTRAHQCNGQNLIYPTTASFSADFSACQARTDTCGAAETAQNPTSCSPLVDVKQMADQIKAVKNGEDSILVAAIFGWPRKDQTSATYKIDKTPSPTVGQPDILDYWPVCTDPQFPFKANGGYDDKAWGMGAEGGLRIKAFLDQFPQDSALPFSICESDYSAAMKVIGETISKKLTNLCVPKKLVDTDLNTPGLQPDCDVRDNVNGKLSDRIPFCGDVNNAKPCWHIQADELKCPSKTDTAGNKVPSQLILVDRPPGYQMAANQKLEMDCRTCSELRTSSFDVYEIDGCKY